MQNVASQADHFTLLMALAAFASIAAVVGTLINVFIGLKLKNSALDSDLKLAEFQNQLIARLNGIYVRPDRVKALEEQCEAAHEVMMDNMGRLNKCLEHHTSHLGHLHQEFAACRARHEALVEAQSKKP